MITMENLKFDIILKEELEGGFTAIVPSLPGCVTYGKDLKEAKKMAQDAILGYLASLKKHKEPIPQEAIATTFLTSINLSVKPQDFLYA